MELAQSCAICFWIVFAVFALANMQCIGRLNIFAQSHATHLGNDCLLALYSHNSVWPVSGRCPPAPDAPHCSPLSG